MSRWPGPRQPDSTAFSSCYEMAGIIHLFIPLAFEIYNSAPKESFSIPSSESITPPSLATPSVEMEAVNGGDGETGERVVGPAEAEPEKDALLHLEASLGHHLPGLTQLHFSPFKSGFLQSSYLII